MCAVSMVYDLGGNMPLDYWTPQKYDYLRELIRKAEEYDRITNQPDCEDAEKGKVLERIEKRLAELENKIGKKA